MAGSKREYTRNTIANLGGNVLLALTVLTATPLLITSLGEEKFGLFRVAFVSVVSYVALFDFGLTSAVRRVFSDCLHSEGIKAAKKALSITYQLYVKISLAVLVATIAIALVLPSILNIPAGHRIGFTVLLLAAGVYVIGQFMMSPLRSLLIGHGRYDYYQASLVTTRMALYGAAVLCATYINSHLTVVGIGTLSATVLPVVLTLLLARNVFPMLAVDLRVRDSALRKRIVHFGLHALFLAIGPVAVYQSQDLLIAAFMQPEDVTRYAVAAVLVVQVRMVCNAFATPLFPIASRKAASTDVKGLRRLLGYGLLGGLWSWALVAIPLFALGRPLLSEWTGRQFAESYDLLEVLLLGSLGSAVSYGPSQILTAAGSIRWLGYSQLIMAGVAVLAMAGTLWFTEYGLIGVAWAVSIPILLRGALIVPCYAAVQIRGMTVGDWANIVIRGVSFVAVSWLCVRALAWVTVGDGLIIVLLNMALCAACVAVLGGVFLLNLAQLRRYCTELVHERRKNRS